MGDQTFRFTLTIEIDAPSREEAEETAQKLVKLSPAMASSLNGNAYRFVDVGRVKPTPEQVAETYPLDKARLVGKRAADALERGEELSDGAKRFLVRALRTLLAATEPPTDEELAEEANTFANGRPESPYIAAMAYIAGARREGRRA